MTNNNTRETWAEMTARHEQELRDAPDSPVVNMADLADVRLIGQIQVGDLVYVSGWLIPVTTVTRTAKTVTFTAISNKTNAPRRFWHWNTVHRSSTPVEKAIGTQVFRRVQA